MEVGWMDGSLGEGGWWIPRLITYLGYGMKKDGDHWPIATCGSARLLLGWRNNERDEMNNQQLLLNVHCRDRQPSNVHELLYKMPKVCLGWVLSCPTQGPALSESMVTLLLRAGHSLPGSAQKEDQFSNSVYLAKENSILIWHVPSSTHIRNQHFLPRNL